MTADFHPLDEYSTDDLVAALMRRSHAVLVASLPRGSVCGHPTFFTFVEWTDFRGVELIGAVEIAKTKLVERVRAEAKPSPKAPDDATGDDE